jgi:hypothetical protein
VRELGILYHPYDLEHGQAQPVEQVAQRLDDVWTRLGRIASDAELPRARTPGQGATSEHPNAGHPHLFLRLTDHRRHRLSDRKLAALTAVHNDHIRRPDGTTAAERFLGCTHETLFSQVLPRMPLPPRPARRRPRPLRQPSLMPLAA